MSFQRYPKYKPSGVEWLGDVPEHWSVMPIRKAAKLESGHTPSRSHPEYWENCTVPWFTLADIWQIREAGATYIFETSERVSEVGLANSSARLLPKGTVMLSRTASVGFSAIMGVDMATTQDFANWICGARLQPLFLLHVLRSMEGEFRRLKMGSTHNTIYMPDIQSMRFVLPPLSEQHSIAAFLDRETAKIDALVAEQKRLMELLKEKRQAVISHAVTKGLNPNAPMKPSGVEWLGDVPAHWSCLHVGKVCRQVADGPHFSPNYVEAGVLFLSARNIRVEGWLLDDVKYVSESDCEIFDRRVVPEIGDVLYTKGGTTGVARVFDFQERVQVWVHIAVLKVNADQIDPYFLAFGLNSVGCYEQSQLLTRGATNNDLGLTRLVKIWFALPPLEEQRRLVAFLRDRTARLDALIAEAQRAIDLLQERRSALISAAVTGQIDVRGLTDTEAT